MCDSARRTSVSGMESLPADLPSAESTMRRLRSARALHATVYRFVRVLAPLAFALLCAGSAGVHPGAGWTGVHLAVALLLTGFAAGGAVAIASAHHRPRRLAAVAVTLLFAAALTAVQPEGPGIVGMLACAATILAYTSRRLARVAIPLCAASVVASSLIRGRPSLSGGLFGMAAIAGVLVLTFLASQMQLAIDQAEGLLAATERTKQAELTAAALSERQQVAREMHDVLAHSLSGLILQLEAGRFISATDPADPRVRQTIERAHGLARAGLAEAGRAIDTLREDVLPTSHQLPELIQAFQDNTGIRCTLTVDGALRALNPDAELAVYRVAQEALTNAARHASPQRVTVELQYQPDGTCLRVEDWTDRPAQDAPTSLTGGGHGLAGMRERAELVGGCLTTGVTNTGFRVALTVPG